MIRLPGRMARSEMLGTRLGQFDALSFAGGIVIALMAMSIFSSADSTAWHPSTLFASRSSGNFMGVALDHSKVALLLETRFQPHMLAMLFHFLMVVPPEWPFMILGHEQVAMKLRDNAMVRRLERMGKLKIDVIDPRWTIDNGVTLTQTTTNIDFYEQYVGHAEHILFWQLDSILCANSEQSINDYLRYDWVGAPWYGWHHGGNGGLSLRTMSSLRKVLRDHTWKDGELLEDKWLVEHMYFEYNDTTVAPADVSSRFSVEEVWAEKPMGYHIGGDGGGWVFHPHIWRNATLWPRMMEWCPEMKLMLSHMKGLEERPDCSLQDQTS